LAPQVVSSILDTPSEFAGERMSDLVDIRAPVWYAGPFRSSGRSVPDFCGGVAQIPLFCTVAPVTIPSGDRESSDDGYTRVPKRDPIAEVLLQTDGLKIAAGLKDRSMLLEEMAAMRLRVTEAGNEQYGSCREGSHDDLVLAVALACWSVKKQFPRALQGDDRWWHR
jgi:hypothetical protein